MFEGLHTALSGIRASQLGMDTAANNIANATTPGYTRQRVDLATLAPWRVRQGEIGMGVNVSAISRLREASLDARARSTAAAATYAGARADLLVSAETAMGEPNNGISQALSGAFDAFDELSRDPSSMALRNEAVNALGSLSRVVRETAIGLEAVGAATQADAAAVLDEANTMLARVDQLNREIAANGSNSNAALDERDLLIDKLAASIGATSEVQSNGNVHVSLDGQTLVQTASPQVRTLSYDAATGVHVGNPDTVVTAGGQVGGIHSFVSDDLTNLQAELDQFALDLRDAFNGVNALGSAPDPGGASWTDGGPPLLAATRAANLGVAAGIAGENVATAALNGRGVHDATNVQRFAALRIDAPPGGGATLDDRLRSIAVGLGSDTADAVARARTSQVARSGAEAARQAGHGVNLDEEMVSLVQHQRSLEAASRALTAIDEALDTLYNRVGIVGR